MLISIFKQFNWVDIIFIILLTRICYVAIKTGFPIEIFKLFGTITAILLSIHYYIRISNFLTDNFALSAFPVEFIDLIVFILLSLLGYNFFVFLRLTFLRLVKIETISIINRWGGLAIGLIRGILLLSLLSFIMAISTIPYVKTSADNSYLGKAVFNIAPDMYKGIWDNIFSKFMPQEKINNIEKK